MNSELARFLTTIKSTHKKGYGSTDQMQGNVTPFGAYAMFQENWEAWSSEAGLGGHDMYDPAAQDYVAAFQAQKLFSRYGSWELVAAAWFAGRDATDVAASNEAGMAFFKNPHTREWLDKFKANSDVVAETNVETPPAAGRWITPNNAPKGWLMPVAGESEWSGGSWMPNTKTHRGRTHAAIDIYSAKGTPIVSPVAGTVMSVKTGDIGGHTIRIKGQDGLTYYFAHMNQQSHLKVGQQVGAGNHIGFVGNTGSARNTKPHVHFSVKKGNTPVNPRTYLEGAKNSNNYFSPEGAAHKGAGGPTMTQNLDSMLQAVSDQIAGGDRQDYRELGLPDSEPDEEGTGKATGTVM